MDKMNKIVENALICYRNTNDFLADLDIDPIDFQNWKEKGYSDDGAVEVMGAYYDGARALPINTLDQITNLVLCEIDESGFDEIVETLNDDLKFEVGDTYQDDPRYIDPGDPEAVLNAFIDYIDGGYNNGIYAIAGFFGYTLVIIND